MSDLEQREEIARIVVSCPGFGVDLSFSQQTVIAAKIAEAVLSAGYAKP